MQTVYIEKEIIDHPRVHKILAKIKADDVIICDHYKSVFNPKAQNFRIQKQAPALILAKKHGKRVLACPPGFGIGGLDNYYFSHMLNCLYDCRYCFLQGMYTSANYVLFVNYDDFMQDIRAMVADSQTTSYFFSGYDCDSLAYEPVSDFVTEFMPFFATINNATIELRTKSTNVKALLKLKPTANCVVAFSFTPQEISTSVEHKVPLVAKRLLAMQALADVGWPIGIRLDPLIYHQQFKVIYAKLLEDIFAHLKVSALHSISVGQLRFPSKMYQKISQLYPNDALLAQPLYRQGNLYSYENNVEIGMKNWIMQLLAQYVNSSLIFECQA